MFVILLATHNFRLTLPPKYCENRRPATGPLNAPGTQVRRDFGRCTKERGRTLLEDSVKHRAPSVTGILAIGFLAAMLGGCGTPSQGLIVGKWELQDGPTRMVVEFHRDGTADLSMLGQTLHGTYKLNADNEMEWNMNGISAKQKVNVTAERLEITDDRNQTVLYYRK
jgi:hypothetical protein